MDTSQQRAEFEARLAAAEQQLKSLPELNAWRTIADRQLREGAARFERIEKSQQLNTDVTLDTRLEMSKARQAITAQNEAIEAQSQTITVLSANVTGLGSGMAAMGQRIAGPLEVWNSAVVGLRMIGRFGDFCMWIGRRWWLILGCLVAWKVLSSGGTVGDAWRAMAKVLSAGPGDH